jgi:outer membrane protein OmpA-like peptidoglycan-associated protein
MKILYLVFICCVIGLYSQENSNEKKFADESYSPRPSMGFFGGAGLNMHFSGFKEIPGFDNTNREGFDAGVGFGYNFGLFYSFPILDNLEVSIRGVYASKGANLSVVQDYKVSSGLDKIVGVKGEAIDGQFESFIETNIFTAGLEPILQYKASDQFRIGAGIRLAYMISGDFRQYEEIVSPSYGLLVDPETGQKGRRLERGSDDLTNVEEIGKFDLGLVLQTSYDMPLNKDNTLFLVPEVRYTLGLISLHPDETWTLNQLAGGIGLRYSPRELIPPPPPPKPKKIPPPPPPPPLPPPPPPPVEPTLDAVIAAFAVEKDGSETDVTTIVVEEFLRNRIHPILSYVFFDEDSKDLPARYIRLTDDEKAKFSFKKFLDVKTMDVYYQVLNIVGKRMQVYPNTNIKLLGCNSNQEKEKNNRTLSKLRAETVRDYLISEWKIDADRISVESRNLPKIPSNPNAPDGIEENRRVEIIPSNELIFEPMNIQDIERRSNPPHLRFKPKINTPMGVQSWQLVTSQKGRSIKVWRGKGNIPEVIDWNLITEDDMEFMPKLDQPLEYKLIVVDNDNKTWESGVQIMDVEQITIETKLFEELNDMEIDEFSIIGFGYNKSNLSTQNKQIADLAKKRVRSDSEIDINGHSDRMGNDDYNLRLSQRRAEAVAAYLKLKKNLAKGFGETEFFYDNNLPEGRFYSRTVRIHLETPVEQ